MFSLPADAVRVADPGRWGKSACDSNRLDALFPVILRREPLRRASKDAGKCLLPILRGAQERAPQDDVGARALRAANPRAHYAVVVQVEGVCYKTLSSIA